MKKRDLTHRELLEHLRYEPETGKWFWLKRWSRYSIITVGAEAGTVATFGRPAPRVIIRIAGHWYYSHVLAWFYMTGKWPKEYVDHKNGDPADNRWENLRAATHGENRANSKPHGRSGRKGVYQKEYGYQVMIRSGGKLRHVGFFKDLEEAAAAYEHAARKEWGEFARSV